MASILVEAVLLVLQCVWNQGCCERSRSLKGRHKRLLSCGKFQPTAESNKGSARSGTRRGSKWEIAKAIFNLIKDSYSASILVEDNQESLLQHEHLGLD